MTSELFFRIILSLLCFSFFVGGAWLQYSTREPKSKSSIDQPTRHIGRSYAAAIILGYIWVGGMILYCLFPNWIMFLSIPLPDWFRLIMVGIAALGTGIVFWAYWALGKNWVHAFETSEFLQRQRQTLVTSGPYHYVRNPVYLGAFIFMSALGLVAANLLILLCGLAVAALICTQAWNEEAMLIDKFGEEYREYMKRTPRFIPKFRYDHPIPNTLSKAPESEQSPREA